LGDVRNVWSGRLSPTTTTCILPSPPASTMRPSNSKPGDGKGRSNGFLRGSTRTSPGMPSGESSPVHAKCSSRSLPIFSAFPKRSLLRSSHGISHKYLEVNRVSWAEGPANHYHNEVPAEITAIFLGLGKLMMNGHNLQRTTNQGSRQITHTRRVGYLDGGQLAFVYLRASHMRGIPSEEFENLSLLSLHQLTACRSRFEDHFQPKFRDPNEASAIRDQIALTASINVQRTETYNT